MTSRTPVCGLFTAALISCLSLTGAVSARALDGPHFAARRGQLHCDRKLTLSEVEAMPVAYVGRVLELRGTVGGSVMADGKLTVMLNMDGGKAVMLDIPAADAVEVRDLATPQLRALVEVKDGATGNVVPLKTLAVTYESEIAAQEKVEQARQDALRKREDWKRRESAKWQATVDRALHHRNVDLEPSRGGVTRSVMPISSLAGSGGLSGRTQPLYAAYYTFIAHRNPRLTASEVSQITFHLLNFADRYNVDPRLVVSMIIAESDFDPRSTSRTGAKGLGQLMPSTARDLGVNNAYDVVQNLGGSINYLRTRLDTFSNGGPPGASSYSFEQVALAMAAYNAGENAVKRYGGVPPYRETQAYVKRVTSLYRQLCQQ